MEILVALYFIVLIIFIVAFKRPESTSTNSGIKYNNNYIPCQHNRWTTHDPGVFSGYPYLVCTDCGSRLPEPRMPF
jgi:hypothetical protein